MLFGIVENVTDPLKLGRVRVRVYGSHDNRQGDEYNIKEKDLAWSEVMMPANTPAKNGVGHSVNLLVGSLVCGIFKDPRQQEFIVMGSLPTKTAGIEDNNIRVRAGADPNTEDPTGLYQPPSTYAPVYPYNNVYETESGHVKEYDDTPGVERITERHASGTRYEIDPNGTKNETIVRDNYKLVAGHDTLEVHGNVKIIVSGDVDIAVAGDVTAEVTGDISLVGVDADGNSQLGIYLENGLDNIKLMTVNNIVTMDNTNKKITLDTDNVEITGDLKVVGTTTTSEDLILDTHQHAGDGGDNSGPNTGGPANP